MYNEYCMVERTYYTVEELVSGWFGERYKALSHGECGMSGHTYQAVTTFDSSDSASAMIDRLNKGTPCDTVVSREIDV